jgi:hypothetical protein
MLAGNTFTYSMHGSRNCAEADLKPNHLGTPLSLGETDYAK